MKAGELAEQLAQIDPEAPLAFSFRDGDGVVWRYASELGIDVAESAWSEDGTGRRDALVEIDLTDELRVLPL